MSKKVSLEDVMSPIFAAIHRNDTDAAKKAIKSSGFDPNQTFGYEMDTPLIAAAYAGRLEVVKMLLEVPKINVNAKNFETCTALYYACIRNFSEIAQELLNHKEIDVNAVTSVGDSASIACCLSYAWKTLLLLAKDKRVDLKLEGKQGETVFGSCIQSANADNILQILWDTRREDFNVTDSTVSHLCNRKKWDKFVKEVISSPEVDINGQFKGISFFETTCLAGNVKGVEYFLKNEDFKVPQVAKNFIDKNNRSILYALRDRENKRVLVKIMNDERVETDALLHFYNEEMADCSKTYKIAVASCICQCKGLSPGEFIVNDEILEKVMEELSKQGSSKAKKPEKN